jgi:hypothetical protein
MNLYLYLPPNSAHPPGVLRSTVYGCLRRYWFQNSRVADFQANANYQKEMLTYSVAQWTNSSERRYHNYGTGSNKSKWHKQDNTAAYKLHAHQNGYSTRTGILTTLAKKANMDSGRTQTWSFCNP